MDSLDYGDAVSASRILVIGLHRSLSTDVTSLIPRPSRDPGRFSDHVHLQLNMPDRALLAGWLSVACNGGPAAASGPSKMHIAFADARDGAHQECKDAVFNLDGPGPEL